MRLSCPSRLACALLFAALIGGAALPAQSLDRAAILPRDKPHIPDRLFPSREREAFRMAISEARRGRLTSAMAHVRGYDRPLAKEMLRWIALRQHGAASFETLREFIETHPDWPSIDLMIRRAEAVVRASQPVAERIAWFTLHPPLTGTGQLAFARALFEAGRDLEAAAWLRRGWQTAPLSHSDQRWWLARFGEHLSHGDHLSRAGYFLWQRNRTQALRLMPLLDADHQALIKARSALIAFAYNVDAAIAKVPEQLRDDPGLVFDRIYWRRIKGKHDSSTDLMLSTEIDGQRIHNARNWWRERHFQARRLLSEGQYEQAYRLAADHAMADGIPLTIDEAAAEAVDDVLTAADLPRQVRAQIAEAEWLAGWIALRFRDAPGQALDHFQRMHAVVNFPISLSRGAYWAGRAAEARGDPMAASAWYREAAQHDLFYYGQLARTRIGEKSELPTVEPAPAPFLARLAFAVDPRVLMVRYLADLGNDHELRVMLSHLILDARSRTQQQLAVALSAELRRPDAAITAAKNAARDGMVLVKAGYPVFDPPPEQAALQPLILGLTRQESLFFPQARSHAGALGLMQLTPATARHTARSIGLPYHPERLTADPDYNVALGSAHLEQLLSRFDGSYVLALAAYNAGPGAVSRWIRLFGDPRQAEVDIVDWVELIPFSETRNYVQRVLDATAIYELLLSGQDGGPRSLIDLLRTGRLDTRSAALAGGTLAN